MMKPAQTPNFHVIIAAAGGATRFGGAVPKQYALLAGKPVLRHSIDKFMKFPNLKSLHVVISPEHAKSYHDAIKGLDLPDFIEGSDSRNKSIYNTLNNLSHLKHEDIILIHDAARPNISEEAIADLLQAMNNADAATLATPVSDTLRKGSADQSEVIDRAGLWAIQTPQAFHYGVLQKAHDAHKDQNFTDDTGLVSAMGVSVKLVHGSPSNMKLTTQDVFAMLERLMTNSQETRTGSGFDVHAFSKAPGRKLILCGIEVDHPQGLEGHSDADVAMHALTDAILGAIGCGDIGQHFPPSNPQFKNMDSRVFLEEACRMMADKGGAIINADITIICEAPKIGPYRDAMRAKIAEILKIDPTRVNVKATTTEGLGFTGRREGIAAQTVVSVKL